MSRAPTQGDSDGANVSGEGINVLTVEGGNVAECDSTMKQAQLEQRIGKLARVGKID